MQSINVKLQMTIVIMLIPRMSELKMAANSCQNNDPIYSTATHCLRTGHSKPGRTWLCGRKILTLCPKWSVLWGTYLTVPLTKHVGGNIPGTRLHARWNGVTTLWSIGIHSEPSPTAVAFVSIVYISWRLKRPLLTVNTWADSISNELWTV